ncbi:MAG TPA: DUF3224 domain-containing protein [Cryptosporangiaceae bacterium]|nr:DUF3224 domain-containing protein [Cryptosporangiaceae bacterium]
MPVQSTGHFVSANWEERQVGPSDAYPRLAHASVSNAFTGGIGATGTTCEYTIAYVAENTGTFTGMEVLAGSLDGRKGTFVVEERGSFDADGSLRCSFEVVPGSGTGDLVGLRGTGRFATVQGDESVPYTFEYDLA